MLKNKLQLLTGNNSDSLSVLLRAFEEKFPKEKGCITLLRSRIFNDTPSISDTKLIEKLENITK